MNILERIKNIFPTHTPIAYSKQELENSTRIQKSTTPKYTTDWYVTDEELTSFTEGQS